GGYHLSGLYPSLICRRWLEGAEAVLDPATCQRPCFPGALRLPGLHGWMCGGVRVMPCRAWLGATGSWRLLGDGAGVRLNAGAWSVAFFFGCRFAALLADEGFFACVVDGVADAVQIDGAFVRGELAGQPGIRLQFAGLEQLPHFLAVPGLQQLRCPAAEVGG